MLDHAMPVLHSLFVTVWRLFTSWYFPGTVITPAAWGFFALAVVVWTLELRRIINISHLIICHWGKEVVTICCREVV